VPRSPRCCGLENTDRFLLEIPVLADTLTALANGVGMQKLNDPDFDVQAFVKAAGVLTGAPLTPSASSAS